MSHIYSAIKITFHKITGTIAMLSEWVLLIITISIFYDVVMRYVFNSPTIWATELSEFLLVFITFIGIAELQKRKSNINMDYFFNKFSPRIRKYVAIINSLFLLIFSAIVTTEAYMLITAAYKYNYRTNTLLSIPLVIPYSLVMIGMFLLLLQAIIDIEEAISTDLNPKSK